MYHPWNRILYGNVLSCEGNLTSLIVSGSISATVRHTDNVWLVGLDVGSNSHTLIAHQVQPEVELAGIVAEWGDGAMG